MCHEHGKLHQMQHMECFKDKEFGIACIWECSGCIYRLIIPIANLGHFVHGAEKHEQVNLRRV